MKLQGKIVVITGASSGIGALTAQMLSERGAVPVLLARSEDKLRALASELKGECSWFVCDVTDEAEVNRTMEAVLDRYGRIDILLNNAGYGKFAAFTGMEPDEFAAMMDVNYMGIVRCTKAVVPHMLARQRPDRECGLDGRQDRHSPLGCLYRDQACRSRIYQCAPPGAAQERDYRISRESRTDRHRLLQNRRSFRQL